MEFPRNITTFLRNLPLKSMRGEDIFVAIAFFLAGGNYELEIEVKAVKNNWQKSVVGKKYNSAFSTRARGRTHSLGNGRFLLTEEGVGYMESLFQLPPITKTSLIVFERGSTHTFDKFIRKLFKGAKFHVDIADTWVSGSIFDNLLDETSKDVPIRFIYGNDAGGFVAKSRRFEKEYNFDKKESNGFHDRFVIVDGKGYIIGPSLKDAADKKPATLVILDTEDSVKLTALFSDLW